MESVMNEKKLEQLLETIRVKYRVPCAQLTVHQNGKQLWYGEYGCQDKEGKVPVGSDSLFWLYSMSKVFTVSLVMKLVGEGKIGLEDPVCKYLPEYETLYLRNTKEKCPTTMTIRHLLTMTGGLDYQMDTPFLQEFAQKTGHKASTREVVHALAENGLIFDPGSRFEYSLCHDVLGAVIEVVTGKTFYEALREQIMEPLGIRDIGFFADEEQKTRIVEQYSAPEGMAPIGKTNKLMLSDCHESGGAGLFGNAKQYCKLMDMLCQGGKAPDGTQLLSPEVITMLSTIHVTGQCEKDFHDKFQNHGLECFSYGLGVRVKVLEDGSSAPGEFGWDGAAGGFALADPDRCISITYMQSVMNHGEVYAEIHPMIRREVYAALKE